MKHIGLVTLILMAAWHSAAQEDHWVDAPRALSMHEFDRHTIIRIAPEFESCALEQEGATKTIRLTAGRLQCDIASEPQKTQRNLLMQQGDSMGWFRVSNALLEPKTKSEIALDDVWGGGFPVTRYRTKMEFKTDNEDFKDLKSMTCSLEEGGSKTKAISAGSLRCLFKVLILVAGNKTNPTLKCDLGPDVVRKIEYLK